MFTIDGKECEWEYGRLRFSHEGIRREADVDYERMVAVVRPLTKTSTSSEEVGGHYGDSSWGGGGRMMVERQYEVAPGFEFPCRELEKSVLVWPQVKVNAAWTQPKEGGRKGGMAVFPPEWITPLAVWSEKRGRWVSPRDDWGELRRMSEKMDALPAPWAGIPAREREMAKLQGLIVVPWSK